MNGQEFLNLLQGTQWHISAVYSGAVNGNKKEQLRSYIEQYLRQSGYTDETELKALTDRLYSEMAEYSVLTKYLGRKDIEEINVNGWDDIAVTYRNGITEKADEHFFKPSARRGYYKAAAAPFWHDNRQRLSHSPRSFARKYTNNGG